MDGSTAGSPCGVELAPTRAEDANERASEVERRVLGTETGEATGAEKRGTAATGRGMGARSAVRRWRIDLDIVVRSRE